MNFDERVERFRAEYPECQVTTSYLPSWRRFLLRLAGVETVTRYVLRDTQGKVREHGKWVTRR